MYIVYTIHRGLAIERKFLASTGFCLRSGYWYGVLIYGTVLEPEQARAKDEIRRKAL